MTTSDAPGGALAPSGGALRISEEVLAAANRLADHGTAREHELLAILLHAIGEDMDKGSADESDSYGDTLCVVDRFDQRRPDWDAALRLARHIGGDS